MFRFPLLMMSIVAVLVLCAALVGPYFLEWQTYRPQIEAQLTQLAGRKVTIGNNITVRLLPAPEVSLENVEIEDPSSQTATPLLKARKLNARLELAPLLRGTFRLASFEMLDPKLNVVMKADGTSNLALLKSNKNFQHFDKVTLDEVVMRNGAVAFHDQRNDSHYNLQAINAVLSASALTGPMRLSGDFMANGVLRHLKLSLGKFRKAADGKSGVRVRGELKTDEAEAGSNAVLTYVFDGRLNDLANNANFKGKFQIAGSPEALQVSGDNSELSLEAQVQGDFSTARFDKIAIVFGRGKRTTALTGHAKIAWAHAPFRIDAALKANQINLASLQPASQGTGQLKALVARLAEKISALDFAGKMTFDAGGIALGAGQIENMGLTLQFSRGRIYVQRALASFPGNTQVTMTGTYRPNSVKRKFSGSVAFRALDARAFARWALPGPVGDVAYELPRTFGNVSLKSGFEADDHQFRLKEAKLKLGNASGKMGLTYAFGARPRFGVRFGLDKIDIDQMLRTSSLVQHKKNTSKVVNAEFAKKLQQFFKAFDANIALSIDDAVYRGLQIKQAEANVKLLKGKLAINQLAVMNMAGARITASGSLSQLGLQPRGRIEADVTVGKFGDLSGLFGVEQASLQKSAKFAQWAARLAPAKLGLELAIAPGNGLNGIELLSKLKGGLATSQLALEARFNGQPDRLERGVIDLQAELSNKASDSLLQQLGVGAKPGSKPQRGLVRTALTGRLNETLDVALGWQAYGVQGALSGSGKFTGSGPALEAQLKVDGKDVGPLLTGLGYETHLVEKTPQLLHVKGLIAGKGREFVLTGFKGALGSNKFSLNGTADFTSERPALRADVKLANLSLPWMLAHVVRGESGEGVMRTAAATDDAWPSTPFNLGLFSAFDVGMTTEIDHVSVRANTQLKAVSTKFDLTDGVLKVHKFAGELLGGRFALDGTIGTQAGQVSLGVNYQLQDGRLERLMVDGHGDVLASGRFALQGKLKGQGLSLVGFISSLSGAGTLSVRDGTLRGINPETFARALQNVNNETELDGYIKGILVDGQMAFSAIDSDFTVRNGLLRMAEMSLKGPGATAQLISFVDLAAYKLDSEWRFKLAAYPKAPPVTLIFSGSLNGPERSFDVKGLRQHLVVEKLNKQMDQLEALQKEQARLARETFTSSIKRKPVPETKPAPKPVKVMPSVPDLPPVEIIIPPQMPQPAAQNPNKIETVPVEILPNQTGSVAPVMSRQPKAVISNIKPRRRPAKSVPEIVIPQPSSAISPQRPTQSFTPDQARGPSATQGPIIRFEGLGEN